MAAKLGLQIYEWVNKFARKLATRPGKEGIMQVPSQEAVRNLSNEILTKFMKHNVSKEVIKSENDVKIIFNQIKNIENQAFTKNFKTALTPKKSAEVLDLTGKKIDTSKPILGGKNVPETEEQILQRLNKQNKETVERLRNKEGPIDWDEVDKIDPEDFAGGGLAGMLGEPTYADDNHRVPYGKGKLVDVARRKFLQWLGAGVAGAGAAKSGLFGLLKGGGKKQVVETLTQVPIKDISGMPAWFKPLVNRVIKEGDDVTKKLATQERQIVHHTNLPDTSTDVIVTQNLDSGNVSVEIGRAKHDFAAGKFGQPVRLEYKAGEVIEPTISKSGKIKSKGGKTKEEFWVEEAEFTGGHPENVKFEESTFEKFGEHGSDFSEVEEFATGLKKGKGGSGHMASGGRVPFFKGKIVKGIMSLGKKKKVNDLGGSKADPFSPDFDMRAEADLIAKTPYTPAELKQLIIKKYKGNKLISDDLLNKILADNDPQRLTEVMATIDEALLMQEKGMNPESIVQSFRDAWGRKKNATGGRVSLSGGGLAGMLGE